MCCLIELEYWLMTAIMYFVHREVPANPIDIVKASKEIGPERCFISFDLGQLYFPLPVDGIRTCVAVPRKCGLATM